MLTSFNRKEPVCPGSFLTLEAKSFLIVSGTRTGGASSSMLAGNLDRGERTKAFLNFLWRHLETLGIFFSACCFCRSFFFFATAKKLVARAYVHGLIRLAFAPSVILASISKKNKRLPFERLEEFVFLQSVCKAFFSFVVCCCCCLL